MKANALDLLQIATLGIQDAFKRAELCKEFLGQGFDILAWNRIGEEQLQNFVIVEGTNPRFGKFLFQALTVLKVMGRICSHRRSPLSMAWTNPKDILAVPRPSLRYLK